MLDFLFRREGANLDGHYYNKTVSVVGGMVDQEVDLNAVLLLAGRGANVGPPRYLNITTDVAVTAKLNDTTSDAIAVSSTVPLTVPLNVMTISRLYLSSTLTCVGGTASVKIFAS